MFDCNGICTCTGAPSLYLPVTMSSYTATFKLEGSAPVYVPEGVEVRVYLTRTHSYALHVAR